ncbi:fused MFS/spermidine synthase [Variovorax sp. LjRoot290]|uniref:fused MFS/spermidine synthase n=1 Tax=unclassified Variovorax TaxID=663243 RepID=UPI003ECED6F1
MSAVPLSQHRVHSHGTRRRAAYGLMVASGFAGLGYQIVWTQQCALWLGHESAAILAVIAAFFGGLAVGALVFGPRIHRSSRPGRWYAACEATMAVWSVLLALLLAPVSHALLDLTGAQPAPSWEWAVAFFGTFLVLLPATAAMGATLPAMERVMAQLGRTGDRIAGLYACNTLGAVLGVLVAAFWLVPDFGLARTAGVCAMLNVLCAAAALGLWSNEIVAVAATSESSVRRREHRALVLLSITGLLGIGYEVLVVRVLSQVAEDTVYTFAMLLAVYLVGTALGAAAYQRRFAEAGSPAIRARLLCLQAAACLLGTGTLWAAEDVRNLVTAGLGAGMASALSAEAALALIAFLPPTIVMGALFSHLCIEAQSGHHSFGRALGFNTLGAAAAPLLFGVVLVPALGPKVALLLVAAAYLALALPRMLPTLAFWVPAGAALAVAAFAPALAFIDLPEGGRVITYREGVAAAVSVVEDAAGVARLRINNRQQEGSSATLHADARQALLPLLLHPAPKRALFLGLGTGVTATAAARDPTLQVDAVELLPEVIAASAHFTGSLESGSPEDRLRVMAADARRFARTAPERYDVIVADNYHPARSGTGSLYTVEHFGAVRKLLTAHGVFCQWLPLHQLDLDSLRSIVQAFLAVNPHGWATLATNSLETPVLGLIAGGDGEGFDRAQLTERLATTRLPQRLADFGIADEFGLLGGFVAGPSALTRFAGNAPANTDDRPIVSYRAPRITYAPDSLPQDRLFALLHELALEPHDLVSGGSDAAWSQRLAAYWVARDRFLEAGRGVRPSNDVRRMLSQVREPLLAALRTSPDFRPAYDPLLHMAVALARTDSAGALSLLTELQQVQPARPEAAQASAELRAKTP